MASFQPSPYAKRQQLNFESRNKRPSALEPREFYPFDYSRVLHHDSTGKSSEPYPNESGHTTNTGHDETLNSFQSHSHSNIRSHGNFVGYYTRRRPELNRPDERLNLVPREWLEGKKVLDIGCNSGRVTVEIAQRFDVSRVTGVDIDDELVKLAKSYVELAWSRHAPIPKIKHEARSLRSQSSRRTGQVSSFPSSSKLDVEDINSPSTWHNSNGKSYFPLSLPRMFGYLPHPKDLLTTYVDVPEDITTGTMRRGRRKVVMPLEIKRFPSNLKIRCADWIKEEIEEDKTGYDIIIAFSVTKWIHLNDLNSGLSQFFSKIFETLLPGGILILEPQAFSTYAKSARLSERLKHNYEQLKNAGEKGKSLPSSSTSSDKVVGDQCWKAENGDFERILLGHIGFERMVKLGETGEKGFRRPVEAYFKKSGGSWV